MDIISDSNFGRIGTEVEETLQCEQCQDENEMKTFIILNKTLYFFIYERPKIIRF